MSEARTQLITKEGQVTVPEDIRESLGIDTPGKVKIVETDGGVLIQPVPHPSEFMGSLSEETDERGRTGTEILEDERVVDTAAEEHRSRE